MTAVTRGEKETVINIMNYQAEDRINKYQNQKQLFAIIDRKNTEISVLQQINTRLGQELYKLQQKLGIDHAAILKQLEEVNQISVSFHADAKLMEYLDSLFMAYDENNLKQKKLIAHLYTALEDSQKKSENLINDNEFLLAEVQGKCKQILQIYSKGFPEENLVTSYSKLQRETEIELLENIREQNQYMMRHFQSSELRNKKLNEELSQAKKSYEENFQNFKSQSEDLNAALIQLDDLIKIKEILEKKLAEITQDNIELESARQQLESKVAKLQGQFKLVRNQYQMHRKSNRDQIQRVNEEFESLKIQSQASQKRERELFNRNLGLEREIQSTKDELRATKLQLEKSKADSEQIIKMCETYEQKITNLNRRQGLNRQKMESCQQELANAILDKQKAELKEKQLQKLIENLNSKNREELETFKLNHEKIIGCQNQKIKFLEEEREDMQSAHHQNQCSLKHQIQKLKRQNSMLKDQNHKHITNLKNQSGSEVVTRIKDLQDKNQSLSNMIMQKQRAFREDTDHKDEMIRNLQNQNRDISRQVDRERATARDATNERTQLKSRISMLQKERDCLEEEVSKLKRNMETKITKQSDFKSTRVRQLEEKLKEAERDNKEIKRKTMQMLEKYDQAEEQIKKEYQNRINQLAKENTKLKHELKKK